MDVDLCLDVAEETGDHLPHSSAKTSNVRTVTLRGQPFLDRHEPLGSWARLPHSLLNHHVRKRSGAMLSNFKKHPETTGKVVQMVPESASDLSEKELSQVAGGFNPQPDPPAILVGQARLTPSDFGVRARLIGG
jgi:hypothetical protein